MDKYSCLTIDQVRAALALMVRQCSEEGERKELELEMKPGPPPGKNFYFGSDFGLDGQILE